VRFVFLFGAIVLSPLQAGLRSKTPAQEGALVPPMLLRRSQLEAGNPLATYAAMVDLETRYRASKPLSRVYEEVRLNFEQFLGDPTAGVKAMGLPGFRVDWSAVPKRIPDGCVPEDALSVVEREARRTRVVIWAEEHHLPQTRSLFEPMLERLWAQGYRYFAAETFADRVMEPDFHWPDYRSGYYLLDPVFAAAVSKAKKLGYRLVSYDTSERGPDGDQSFRDRTQAANIKARIFDKDAAARVLIIAGRGHSSETVAPDGWTPMAACLKQTTGIDPFTVYAPTMSERRTRAEEHPWYVDANSNGLVKKPVIFVRGRSGETLGSGSCDAYVFWPTVRLMDGRPDWMATTLGRKSRQIPTTLRVGEGRRLVQVFATSAPSNTIPIDQVLLPAAGSEPALMLPPGDYRVRTIDENSNELASGSVKVE
jgi:hypothetical protein